MTPLLFAPLVEIFYDICLGNKKSCFHIGIKILRWVFHQLIFEYVNLYMQTKRSVCKFFLSYGWIVHKKHLCF